MHIDLTKYFTFDNDYNFFSFKQLYKIEIGPKIPHVGFQYKAEYFDHVPVGVDQTKVMHLMKYIKLLIIDKDHKNTGPFVIQLDRIKGKVHTSEFVVAKLFLKDSSIKDQLAAKDKDRLVLISLDH